jgi:arabinogalactan oligomer/maltooligosaccharide transport system substrate-binding protein
MTPNRRRSVASAATLGLAISLVLAACGGSGTADSAASAPASEAPASVAAPSEPAASSEAAPALSGSLVIWGPELWCNALGPAIKSYTEETGVSAECQVKPEDGYDKAYTTAVPLGEGPDLFIAYNGSLAAFVNDGVVAPVDILDRMGEFRPAAAAGAMVDGKAWMTPLWTENIALLRNTELAPTAPATTDEMVATGQQIVKDGKAEFTLAVGLDPAIADPYHLYGFNTSLGAPVFGSNPDGTYNENELLLDSPGGFEFAQMLSDWGKNDVINPDLSYDVALETFTSGKAPYYITGPWYLPAIKDAGIKYAIDPIPTAGPNPSSPFIGVLGLVVNPQSSNLLVAQDFAGRYMLETAPQVGIFTAGAFPPALQSAFDEVSTDPDVRGWGLAGEYGVAPPQFPVYNNTLYGLLGTAEMNLIRGKGGSPEKVWQQMIDAMQDAIAKSEG